MHLLWMKWADEWKAWMNEWLKESMSKYMNEWVNFNRIEIQCTQRVFLLCCVPFFPLSHICFYFSFKITHSFTNLNKLRCIYTISVRLSWLRVVRRQVQERLWPSVLTYTNKKRKKGKLSQDITVPI